MTLLARDAKRPRTSALISLSVHETNVDGIVRHAAVVTSTTDAANRCGRSRLTNSPASPASQPRPTR